MACIPICVLGALICFLWARDLYGKLPGLLALSLWTCSPTVLAYGAKLVPDLAAAAFGLTANYVFWKWLRRPSWKTCVIAGALLGVVQLTKFTWILLFALWPLIWCMYQVKMRTRPFPREMVQLACTLILGVYIINLGYAFDGSFASLEDFHFRSHALRSGVDSERESSVRDNRFRGQWSGRWAVPLPAEYVLGIDAVKREFEHGYLSYLRGEWRNQGWWYFYLYAMAIKIPAGTWGILLLSLVATVRSLVLRKGLWDELVLLAPAIVILAFVSSQTGFNHHIRYVFPAFGFLFIWASKVGQTFQNGPRSLAVLTTMLLAWTASSSLWIFPHSGSYFNELVGGPKNGHYHLGNSNVDWGQDLLFIEAWYRRRSDAHPLYLAYHEANLIDPGILGIEYEPVPAGPVMNRPGALFSPSWPWDHQVAAIDPALGQDDEDLEPPGPQPGWHIISVNQIHRRDGRYEYFLEFEPVDFIGYSTYVFHLSFKDVNEFRRRIGMVGLSEASSVD
jgi:4-amino-4-deoxy-L-arabinose transferase-like glycosyltransferase